MAHLPLLLASPCLGQPALVWSWQLEEPSEVLLAGEGLRLCLDPAGYRHLG